MQLCVDRKMVKKKEKEIDKYSILRSGCSPCFIFCINKLVLTQFLVKPISIQTFDYILTLSSTWKFN